MDSIIIVSNFLSPHQVPLCEEFLKRCKSFHFVATKPIGDDRIRLGYEDLNGSAYVIREYESDELHNLAIAHINNADCVIIGSAPDSLIIQRLKKGRITFKYQERILKKPLNYKTLPRFVIGTWLHHGRFMKYPLYLLCASAFTYADMLKLGYYKNRAYKWGYFPPLCYYMDFDALFESKQDNSILWVGRMIDWKHPELPILIAERLKKENIHFTMNMIGVGEMETKLKGLIKDKNLENDIHLLGSMESYRVRQWMEKSQILLCTSDRYEGWGAVVNEGMNSACIVVVSDLVGSAPYLINDNDNGFIFPFISFETSYLKVKNALLLEVGKKKSVAQEAYCTIANKWNASVAAQNFMQLYNNLTNHQNITICEDEPCSLSSQILDNWYTDGESPV